MRYFFHLVTFLERPARGLGHEDHEEGERGGGGGRADGQPAVVELDAQAEHHYRAQVLRDRHERSQRAAAILYNMIIKIEPGI